MKNERTAAYERIGKNQYMPDWTSFQKMICGFSKKEMGKSFFLWGLCEDEKWIQFIKSEQRPPGDPTSLQ